MHVKPLLPALLLVLGGLVSAAGAVGAVENARVAHQLEVETSGGKVKLRLIVENRGETTIYVPREVAAGEEITGRRFDLRDAKGGRVDYTGMMVKRGALTAADWQAVAPHSMHMNTIDITPSYAFGKGRQGYEIRYEGPWLADTAQLDALQYSPAKPVKFSFGK